MQSEIGREGCVPCVLRKSVKTPCSVNPIVTGNTWVTLLWLRQNCRSCIRNFSSWKENTSRRAAENFPLQKFSWQWRHRGQVWLQSESKPHSSKRQPPKNLHSLSPGSTILWLACRMVTELVRNPLSWSFQQHKMIVIWFLILLTSKNCKPDPAVEVCAGCLWLPLRSARVPPSQSWLLCSAGAQWGISHQGAPLKVTQKSCRESRKGCLHQGAPGFPGE